MSDNDGYNVVASAIRRQMMVKGPLPTLKALMIRDGLSVSEAIRKYTALYGLPPDVKEIEQAKTPPAAKGD